MCACVRCLHQMNIHYRLALAVMPNDATRDARDAQNPRCVARMVLTIIPRIIHDNMFLVVRVRPLQE